MFSRLRLYIGGQLAEDLTEVGHLAMLLERIKPNARRLNDSLEAHAMTANLGDEAYSPIPANGARKVVFSLPFGMLNQQKWMPFGLVAAGGIVLEAELSSNALQAFTTPGALWRIQDVSCTLRCTRSIHPLQTA